jgi:hypothetical protein
MTTGFMMGFPNTSSGVVQKTDGGILYDPNQGNIYGLAQNSADGLNGWRKWDAWPNGDELRARNLADLANGVTVYPVHCLLGYQNLIVMSGGTANSQALFGFTKDDLSYAGTFGVTSASLANSDSGRILAAKQVVSFLDAKGRDCVVATPIRNGSFTGGAEINCITWGSKTNRRSVVTENHAVLGSIPDGTGRNAWAIGYNLGTDPMTLYRIGPTLGGNGIQATVGTVAVTDIDPTWTNIDGIYGIAVDQVDGHLVCGFATDDTVTHRAYLVKLNSATGAVMWAAPVGNGLNYPLNQGDLARSTIKNSKLYYIGATGQQFYTINTTDGTADTSVVLDSGGLASLYGSQISEDVSGSVVWYGSWSEGDLHPAYLGTYCLTDGHHSGSQMVWRFWPAPSGFVTPVYGPQVTSRKRAWSYVLDGHTFYVLDLGAQGTFVYDQSTNQWSKFITEGYLNWNFASGCMWGQRIVAGDLLTTDIWEMNPSALFDNGATEIVHVVTGSVATRSRTYHSVDSFRLACSVGQVLDPNGASVTLSFSDDQGETWTTMDTIPIPEGNITQEIAWLSLGAFSAPGRIFKITDSGGFLRIEGADAGIDGVDPVTADSGR